MAGNLFYYPRIVAIHNGVVVPGAKLVFTATGTSTPQAVYTDVALTTPHDDPVEADSNGVFDPIYMDPSDGDFRVELTDANDVQLQLDNDIPASQAGQNLILTAAAPYIDLIESDASSNNGVWRVYANSEQLKVQLGNDAKDSFADVIVIDRTANNGDTLALTFDDITITGDVAISGAITDGGVAVADPIISEAIAFVSWLSSETFADITTPVSLLADTDYGFDLNFILDTDAAADFKLRFHTADTLTLDASTQAMLTVIDESAGTVQGEGLQGALDTAYVIDGSGGLQYCTIRGSIRVDAAGSFSIQGAQNTSDVSSTSITQGGLFSIWPIRSA